MIYVYELRVGERVIDAGVSNNVKTRLRQHTQTRNGKYYGRKDITIHTVSEWPTRKLAMKEEGRVKISHGLKWTEDIGRKNSRILTMEIAREIRTKYKPRVYTRKMLMQEYNVSEGVIKGIVNNVYYMDV
tara:strand:- start:281 stop:670 length:390 start_codon:yes stop_codon:yes gene_type:complete